MLPVAVFGGGTAGSAVASNNNQPQSMAKTKTQAATNVDVGAATAALKAIPDGKVVDFITGRLLDDTPEEY